MKCKWHQNDVRIPNIFAKYQQQVYWKLKKSKLEYCLKSTSRCNYMPKIGAENRVLAFFFLCYHLW